MISLANQNPYMLYIKIGLAMAAVVFLFWLGWHEMGIRADLQIKTAEAAMQKATTEMYAKQFQDYINLNKEIADAVKDIKIKSNNYIQTIESSPPPVAADGDTVVLVPAGVPIGPTLPAVSGHEDNPAGRTSAGAAGDPGGQAGK